MKGNLLEWANEVPKQRDVPIRVYVTLQEERSTLSAQLRRRRIVEILEKLQQIMSLLRLAIRWNGSESCVKIAHFQVGMNNAA
ncbi:MAG: hypothetical protein HC849_01175 [Oscillatoriales cyanobacterium RU_3_3]|nr:hypothetical protein [Oscillatoriales cyanobacterium RU_3_3]